MIVARRDDLDETVTSVVNDIPPHAEIRMLCRRVLLEMGLNDPFAYEFILMVFIERAGGTRVVLEPRTLRRYVRQNYG